MLIYHLIYQYIFGVNHIEYVYNQRDEMRKQKVRALNNPNHIRNEFECDCSEGFYDMNDAENF